MDESLIKSICKKEFGEEPDSIETIAGGLMNTTCRVRYPEESYIVQVNSNTEPHEMENCLKCFQFLQNSKVPVPETITEEVGEYDSGLYTIVEDLKADSINENLNKENSVTSGKYLAYIHDSKSFEKAGWWEWKDGEPTVIGFPGDSLKSRIKKNLEDKLEFFQDEDIDWLIDVTQRFLDSYLDFVPTDFEPVFVHHDYNPGNILATDGEIKGIVDFDYAHASHGQRDLVKAANNFWIRGRVDRKHVYNGYKQVRNLGDDFEQNEPVYRLETFIDILKAMIELDNMSKEEAKKYQETVEEMEKQVKKLT
jgi:fructosamine-3-kinase